MTTMSRELARKLSAEIVQTEPQVTDGETQPPRRVVPGALAAVFKVIAFLLLAFGLFGYVIASMQTL